jgi:hypothetical protein
VEPLLTCGIKPKVMSKLERTMFQDRRVDYMQARWESRRSAAISHPLTQLAIMP